MQIKTVKFDVAGAMAAMLLNQFHKHGIRGSYLYMVSATERMYDPDGLGDDTLNVAVGYKRVEPGSHEAFEITRDLYDLDSPTWVEYGHHALSDNDYSFLDIPIGETRHYRPVPLVGLCWSPLNSPDHGFVVTELSPDIDLTKDGVIKLRPDGMSETDAHKHIGKLPGRIEFTQALSILHRLNYIQQLANIAALADDDEGEE